MSNNISTVDPDRAEDVNKTRNNLWISIYVFAGIVGLFIIGVLGGKLSNNENVIKASGIGAIIFVGVTFFMLGVTWLYNMFNAGPYCKGKWEPACREDGYLYYTEDDPFGNACYGEGRKKCS